MAEKFGLTAGEVEVILSESGLAIGNVSNPDELRKAIARIITTNNELILEEVKKLILKHS